MGTDENDASSLRNGIMDKVGIHEAAVRRDLLDRIDREIHHHQKEGNGHLAFKMNALVDKPCIQALYRAAQAGVKIDLQVRGICCLRPGIPGVSDTVTVTSVVGRFLEHVRIYFFHNGGQEEVLLGSADLMPRNLDRRVEILFPVLDLRWREIIVNDILAVGLRDNVQARRLRADGTYERLQPSDSDPAINSQEWFVNRWKSRS